ncbi:hypothetical protein T492DRAFT_1148156 [Pavlovales sp. CCMP2436]|nr:hypothetical protein T492DRAFT_1148156 [Pavlovales sp. CCMP2436]
MWASVALALLCGASAQGSTPDVSEVFRVGMSPDAKFLAAAQSDYESWITARRFGPREPFIKGAYRQHRAFAASHQGWSHGTDESSSLYLVGVQQIRKRAGGRQRLHSDLELSDDACAGAGAVSVWLLVFTGSEEKLESRIKLIDNFSTVGESITPETLLQDLNCWSPSTWHRESERPSPLARCFVDAGRVWHATQDFSGKHICSHWTARNPAAAVVAAAAPAALVLREARRAEAGTFAHLANPLPAPGIAGTARAERCGEAMGNCASTKGARAVNTSALLVGLADFPPPERPTWRSTGGAVSTYHWRQSVTTKHIALIIAQRALWHTDARALAHMPHIETSTNTNTNTNTDTNTNTNTNTNTTNNDNNNTKPNPGLNLNPNPKLKPTPTLPPGRVTYAVSTSGACGEYAVYDSLPGAPSSRRAYTAKRVKAPLTPDEKWPHAAVHRALRGMDAVYQPNARPTALIAPLSGAEFAPGQLVENKIVSLAGPEAAVLGYKRLLAKVTAFGAGASYRVHTGALLLINFSLSLFSPSPPPPHNTLTY